jgi:hypothetical protein
VDLEASEGGGGTGGGGVVSPDDGCVDGSGHH